MINHNIIKMSSVQKDISILLVFKLILLYILCSLNVSALLTMKFNVGKLKYVKYALGTTVPTMYQCAEICLLFKSCTYFNFVKRTQNNCLIIKTVTTDPNISKTYKDYIYRYMAKGDIPMELAGSCANHACGEYEICVREGKHENMCLSLHQCIDGLMEHESNCNTYGNVGGCEKDNIGKNLTMTNGKILHFNYPKNLWNRIDKYCDRKCKKCLQIY